MERLYCADEVYVKSFQNTDSGYKWAVSDVYSCFVVEQNGSILKQGWKVEEITEEIFEEYKETLVFLQHTNGLKLRNRYKEYSDCSVVEMDSVLENKGNAALSITNFSPLCFNVKCFPVLTAYSISRDKYSMQSCIVDDSFTIHGGKWNEPENAGWLVLESTEKQESLFLGIQWEREWYVSVVPEESGYAEVKMGLENFTSVLQEGEILFSPVVFVGSVSGGLDDAANGIRRYLMQHVCPKPMKNFPWVTYDIWSTEGENVEETIRKEADFAADIGVECFYIDASWWAGSSIKSDGAWGFRLGNYIQDRRKFPSGLAAMSEYVHSKGMKFGLWVDPIVVDEHWVSEGMIPEKWLVKNADGIMRLDLDLEGWPGLNQLCTGNVEVQEYIITKLSELIQELKLDWLKWDDSALCQPVECTRDDHGHQADDGNYMAAAGKYRIFKELHKRFPDLVIEACGVPARIDYGLAPYIRSNWLSDGSAPTEKVVNNMEFSSYVYPNSYNSAWLIEHDEILNECSQAALDTVVRGRMMGLIGMGTLLGHLSERMSLWPTAVHEALRRNLPFYKEIRHLLSQDVYHYNNDSDIHDFRVMACVSYDKDESITYVFRLNTEQSSGAIKLKGLKAEARYLLSSLNAGEIMETSGKELMTKGVFVDLSLDKYCSDIFRAKEV